MDKNLSEPVHHHAGIPGHLCGLPEEEGSQVGLQGSASAAHDRRSKTNESR